MKNKIEELKKKIVRKWLINEKLSAGRMDYPLPKLSYGQLKRLVESSIQEAQKDFDKKVEKLKKLIDSEDDLKYKNYLKGKIDKIFKGIKK